jgi:hypothetical protein
VADALQNADEAMDKILSPLNEEELQEQMADDLQQNANMDLKESAVADDDQLRVVYDDLHEAEETDVHEADDDVQAADGDHLESADNESIRQPNNDVNASAADVLVVEGEDKLLEFEIMFGLVQAKDEPLVEDAPHPLLEDEPHGQEAVVSYENYDYGELAGQTGKCVFKFIHENIYLEQLKQIVQFYEGNV